MLTLESRVVFSPPIARYPALNPLSLLGPAIQSRERDICANFIYKHQRTSIEGASYHHRPGSSLPFVSFQRPHSPSFRLKPTLFRSLLRVGLGVTLDRGEADGEQAGGLRLRCPALVDGLNYFLAQVF